MIRGKLQEDADCVETKIILWDLLWHPVLKSSHYVEVLSSSDNTFKLNFWEVSVENAMFIFCKKHRVKSDRIGSNFIVVQWSQPFHCAKFGRKIEISSLVLIFMAPSLQIMASGQEGVESLTPFDQVCHMLDHLNLDVPKLDT